MSAPGRWFMPSSARLRTVMVASALMALVLAGGMTISRRPTRWMRLALAYSSRASALESSLAIGSNSPSSDLAATMNEVHRLEAVAWEYRRRSQQPWRPGEPDPGRPACDCGGCSGRSQALAALR